MVRATERPVVLGLNDNNNRFNINAYNDFNNNRRALGMANPSRDFFNKVVVMKTYKNLWRSLIGFDNLENAYWSARKHKSNNPKVIEFDKKWRLNLCILLRELRDKTYRPLPLRKFILRDPKTRTICVSDFRDRIVHHAIVNVLKPIFEPRFIFDSYASRLNKGTLPALKRFDKFKRKISRNNRRVCFVLKADIKHYFQTVNHQVLLDIVGRKIKDKNVLWLIKIILGNYDSGIIGEGMPLGNWTSQFFANIYLNELDQFIKNKLKAKYYLRYVDDFVILHTSKQTLLEYEKKIGILLSTKLKLKLHPDKCQIVTLNRGVSLLGFRVFYYHKIPRKRNIRKIKNKLVDLMNSYEEKIISATDIFEMLQGWSAYAMCGNTYKLRKRLKKHAEQELIKRTPIY